MRLVEAAALTKKILTIIAVILVIYIIGLMLKQPIKSGFYALFPPKNLPTALYGKLEPLEFTEIRIPSEDIEYSLNTTTGKLPKDIPPVLPVYKYKSPKVSYSAGKETQEHATYLGFSDDMRISKLSESIFEWEDVRYGGNLKINLNTREIELITPLEKNARYFPAGKLNKTKAIEIAKESLKEIDRLTDPLYLKTSIANIKVTLGKFRLGNLVKANSTLEAQIAKVDFFREINDYPILGPNASEGLIQIYLRNFDKEEKRQLNFPIIDFHSRQIDTNDDSTYPITPINLVWKEITAGNGVISSVLPKDYNPFNIKPPTNINEIVVNDIYIAYYDNKNPQKHMQPIYVFEGNYRSGEDLAGRIIIYYPAISKEYLNLGDQTNTDEPYLPQL